jgi:hypothetical protein
VRLRAGSQLCERRKSGSKQGSQFLVRRLRCDEKCWLTGRGCPNNPRSRCKFFEWADEADAPEPDPYASSNGRGRGGAKSSRGKGKARGAGGGGAGAEGGGQSCYKCGEEGHWANNCPGAGRGLGGGGGGGGGSGSDQPCFKCGQSGHWANSCPSGGDGSGGGRGGGPVNSGIAGQFRARMRPRAQLNGSLAECFKCGGLGHFANRCTNEGVARGRPAQKGTPGDGKNCFNCNQKGHWSSECTVTGPKGPGTSRAGGRGGRAGAGGAGGGSSDGESLCFALDLERVSCSRADCFKCGQPGHWASNCTNT